jgi:hypothetical protein
MRRMMGSSCEWLYKAVALPTRIRSVEGARRGPVEAESSRRKPPRQWPLVEKTAV